VNVVDSQVHRIVGRGDGKNENGHLVAVALQVRPALRAGGLRISTPPMPRSAARDDDVANLPMTGKRAGMVSNVWTVDKQYVVHCIRCA